ncbi:MAG TPA: glycosyltransferase family 4 protein [Pyrinomonadaceae bacterium]|nr:glycosyltransferase family 4 protein [Pyrinomonadaceae bacterium]
MANEPEALKRRLWVVTELYYPEETSTGYYLTRIAEGLAEDFDVKALCGQPTYSARGIVAPKHEIHNGVEIFRASGTTLDKNVIVFRLVNMLTLGLSVFLKSLRNFRQGDRVLVVTTPPSMPFVVALAALVKGTSYTLLIHDNYPEILIAVGKSRPGSLLAKIIAFCNRWLYKYAAKIIVVGRDMQELLSRKTAGLDIPIVTIPNWAELESVAPSPRDENALLAELGLSDKFVFLYAGNLGHPNDLESIVECAAALRERSDVHFIFLGTGVKRKWLESRVRELALKNVTVLDPRPRSEQRVFLNACDVGLVSLVKNMVGVSMPSRTYNILAAGRPILALTEEDSELARVVREDRVGWVTPPNDPTSLSQTIADILRTREDLPAMGEAARTSAVTKYSLEKALDEYRRVL